MSRKNTVVVVLLSIVAILIALFAVLNSSYALKLIEKRIGEVQEAGNAEAQEGATAAQEGAETQGLTDGQDVQYVLYLGTNDKDTNEPVFPPEEAKAKAEEILLNHFGGYTIQEASGGWIDGDKVYTEYTLVIYLSDTDLESVHAAASEMIDTFHQSSVLIQANETKTEFYAGE